ncbi:MAG: CshA/CshB family fibrillar adhesin-related protein [Bifidobacteriaceae bacterium]|jgi:fimbrial isopeptide formation D2 family protein/uncharacterized repeat protein (TIGR01451 family)|nr:CshA/CshB family fibrillar adhesin-related protein [Bifidobacteriaceae bacterium]
MASLVAGMGVVGLVAQPAEARFATGGAGLYRGLIDWIEWGTVNREVIASPMATNVNQSRQVGSNSLKTTCTLTSVPTGNHLVAYMPGEWASDGFDDLYHMGGTGTSNQLINGLRTTNETNPITVGVSCEVTLDDVPVPIGGLVIADAETSSWSSSLGNSQPEYVAATPVPAAGVTWRVIDRYRGTNCEMVTYASRNAGNQLTFNPGTEECASEAGGGPIAVAFMEGATAASLVLKGHDHGGSSAIALGVVINSDFGDAPAGYPEAGALYEPEWTGGEVDLNPTVTNTSRGQNVWAMTLGTPLLPVPRLGDLVDSESAAPISATATGDDANPAGSNDEDIPFPANLDAFRGGTVTVGPFPCTGPGWVQGWIDWDHDQDFDPATEASGALNGGAVTPGPTLCSDTREAATVMLSFAVPDDAQDGVTFARLRIAPTEESAATPSGLVIGGEVEDHRVSVELAPYTVTKSVVASTGVVGRPRAGDQITYAVTVTNVGEGTVTPAATVTIKDDLTDVLDDGDYNADASDNLVSPSPPSTFTLQGNVLAWALAAPLAGESATMTYSVTLKDGGDRMARNVSWADDPDSPGTPACARGPSGAKDTQTGEACDVEEFSLPYLTVAKTSNATSATRAGDTVTYEVTIVNQGPGVFTSDAPALVYDDLTDLDDDATYVNGSAQVIGGQGGSLDGVGPLLSWSGPMTVGQSVTVRYSVVLREGGDGLGRDVAWIPNATGGGAAPVCDSSPDQATGERCARVVQGIPRLAIAKTVTSMPSGAGPGAELTYTLKVTNVGTAPYTAGLPAVVRDNLARVLDDADYVAGSVTADRGTVNMETAVRRLSWSGALDPLEEATITYRVTATGGGDGRLDNVAWQVATTGASWTDQTCVDVAPEDGKNDADGVVCAATHLERPVLAVAKTATVASVDGLRPDTVITYRVTATNQGSIPFTAQNPAYLNDSLAGVLSDATYNSDAVASDLGPVSWDGTRLAWSGPLAVGASVTIVYTVTVKPFGVTPPATGTLRNVAWWPETPDSPAEPACRQATGTLDTVTREACAATTTLRPILDMTKTVTTADLPGRVGSVVHYSITARNVGAAAFSGVYPAVIRDDLSEILDDAVYLGDAAVAPNVGTVYFDTEDGRQWLRWSGPLPVGDAVTLTYSVRLIGGGDGVLTNLTWNPVSTDIMTVPDCTNSPDPVEHTICQVVDVERPVLALTKSHATTDALVGDTVEYTFTATNVGRADYTVDNPAVVVDSLTDVLLDATYLNDAEASFDNATWSDAGLTWSAGRLTWRGPLESGQSVTVRYSVELSESGDGRLTNIVWEPANPASPVTPASCSASTALTPAAEACAADTVARPLLRVWKRADWESAPDPPTTGTLVTYTVTVENIGAADYPTPPGATYFDDLSQVLANSDGTLDESTITVNGMAQDLNQPGPHPDPNVDGTAFWDESHILGGWNGPLPAGGRVEVSYGVLLMAASVPEARNVAWVPNDPDLDDATAPDCTRVTGGVDAVTKEPCAAILLDRPGLSFKKEYDLPADGNLGPGSVITFHARLTNTGTGDFTLANPMFMVEDMRNLLANGELLLGTLAITPYRECLIEGQEPVPIPANDPRYADYIGTVDRNNSPYLTWTAALDEGGCVDMSFDYRLDAVGTSVLFNRIYQPNRPADPFNAPTCAGENTGPNEDYWGLDEDTGEPCSIVFLERPLIKIDKSAAPVDGSVTTLRAGDKARYTLSVANSTDTPATGVVVHDDVRDVLAKSSLVFPGDTTVTFAPTVPSPVSDLTLDRAAGRLTWHGDIPAHHTVTITYEVTLIGGTGWEMTNIAWQGEDPDDPDDPPVCDQNARMPCDSVVVQHPTLQVMKAAQAPAFPRAGSVVTYDVTLRNTSALPFTDEFPATVIDNLADVLDSAVWNNDLTILQPSGAPPATYVPEDQLITWTGPINPWADVVMRFSVTLVDDGDGDVRNIAWAPVDPDDPGERDECDASGVMSVRCDEVTIERAMLDVDKTVVSMTEDPPVSGSVITYKVTATATGALPFTAANPAVVIDDLSDILLGATYSGDATATVNAAPATSGLTYDSPLLSWHGAMDPGDVLELTFTVRLDATGDGLVRNIAWAPGQTDRIDPVDCDGGLAYDPDTGEACAGVEFERALLGVRKEIVSRPSQAIQGATVTYAVSVDNVGQVAYDLASPALIMDDLTDVLTAATFDGTGVSVTPPIGTVNWDADTAMLSWSGPLGIDEEVRVEYTVTLTGTGSGSIRNVAWGPRDPDDPHPDSPACVGAVSADGRESDPATGEACASETYTYPRLAIDKSVSPTGPARPGDTREYTVKVTNTGSLPYTEIQPAAVWDALADLASDAQYVFMSASAEYYSTDGTHRPAPLPGNIRTAALLTWEGPLAVGESVWITYQVVLLSNGTGDVRNVAWQPNDPLGVDTEQPVSGPPCVDTDPVDGRDDGSGEACSVVQYHLPQLTLSKERAGGSGPTARSGDVITYTITATSVGHADFTALNPAEFVDALDEVLDDATYLDDATLTCDQVGAPACHPSTLTYRDSRFHWQGPLAVGESVTLTYSVRLRGDGDGHVENTVWRSSDPTEEPPVCVEGSRTTCAVDQFDRPMLEVGKTMVSYTQLPDWTVATTREPDGSIYTAAGATVTYQISVTNRGAVPFTLAGPAVVVDDFSDLLDGSVYSGDARDDDGDPTTSPTFTYPYLRWEGPLDVGATVTITYSVVLNARGNGEALNMAWEPNRRDATNPPAPACPVGGVIGGSGVDPDTGEACGRDYWRRPVGIFRKTVITEGPYLPGMDITFELTGTNISQVPYTEENPAWIMDDVTDLLAGATFDGIVNVEPPTAPPASYTAPLIEWHGPIDPGASISLTFTVKLGTAGPGTLRNVIWRPNTNDPGGAPNCEGENIRIDPVTGEACAGTALDRYALDVTKSVTSVSDDGTVSFQVVATNPGPLDFDQSIPAVVADDMGEVLARATLVGTPTASMPGVIDMSVDDILTWTGALASGESVTISYETRLAHDAGSMRNVAWAPNDPTDLDPPACLDADQNPLAHGTDAVTAEACAIAIVDNPVVHVTKTSDGSPDSRPGDVITYTLRLENTGDGPFTTERPAMVVDDLSGVLDDAQWLDRVQAAGGTADFADGVFTWRGPIAAHGVATVTYQVLLGSEGDGIVANVAWVPLDPMVPTPPSCDGGAQRDPISGEWCDREEFGLPMLRLAKRTDGTADSMPGDRVTYWVDLTNAGSEPFTVANPAWVIDDLSGVLTGARLVESSLSDNGAGGTFGRPDQSTVTWNGPIPVGGTVTLTLAVVLTTPGSPEARNLAWVPVDPDNRVAPACELAPGGMDATTGEFCATVSFPRQGSLALTKTSTMSSETRIGDTVKFTVDVQNSGGEEYTEASPLLVVDDMSGVLDDATYLGDASDGGAGGTFAVEGTMLRWEGPLGFGASVQLTYSVRVTGGGDLHLRNSAWIPTDDGRGSVDDEEPPACPAGPMDGRADQTDVLAETGEPCNHVDQGLPKLSVAKRAVTTDPGLAPGGVVRWVIEVANVGTAPFTVAAPAELTDSLDGVLGAAAWNGDLIATRGRARLDDGDRVVIWRGALAVGQSATITYSTTVRTGATGTLTNTACGATSTGAACSGAAMGIPSLAISKRVVGAVPTMRGEKATFEVTAINNGTAAFTGDYPARVSDDLTDVLDDATLDVASVSAIVGGIPAGTVAPMEGGLLGWTGPLGVGQTVTLTYTVTYAGDGNRSLLNVACVPVLMTSGEPCADATTLGPNLTHTKTAKLSTSTLRVGTLVTYTLRFVNTGRAVGRVDSIDPLEEVFDDAMWVDGPTVRPVEGLPDAVAASSVSANLAGSALSIQGTLAPAAAVDIVYVVRMGADGDGLLLNYLIDRGPDGGFPVAPSEGECIRGSRYPDNCVLLAGSARSVTPAEPPEDEAEGKPSDTGAPPGTVDLSLSALSLIALGAVLLLTAHRRSRRVPRHRLC